VTAADIDWDAIRAELIAMAEADLALRDVLARDGSLFEGYQPRMQGLHKRNAARLRELLDCAGWPGRYRVGAEGAHAAWLILQHAISDPPLQRRGLRLLQRAVARGEAAPVEAAMLEDRIRIYEGRPQLYGTQFDWDEHGRMSPLPIEDAEHVDERRAAIGLMPLAEDIERRRAAVAEGPERPPKDWAAYRETAETWLRSVGWRCEVTSR
jgi:hypothetical protein